MSMLLSIHIAAGGLAMVLGAEALLVKKGGTSHRRSGLLFVAVHARHGHHRVAQKHRRSSQNYCFGGVHRSRR